MNNGVVFDCKLSIVVPAFNEEKRIGTTLEAIHRHFSDKGITREIIVVDDGSNDRTAEVVTALKETIPELRLVRYHPNRGKGYAVKAGVEQSRGEYILFTDADNSTPIEEFDKFFPLLRQNEIVIGSRFIAGSDIKIRQPKFRIVMSRLGNLLVHLLLYRGIKDTWCGFKAFQHGVAGNIFSRMKVNRIGFDIELLAIANLLKYSIREVPVNWYYSPMSRIRPIKDNLGSFFELLFVKCNLLLGRYDSIKSETQSK